MKLLIIGGTVFLGRYIVQSALERGHEVTMFNRGRHNPELFPEVERIQGDRDGDLGLLAGRQWDAVIDTCGYFPRVVRASARQLSDSVGHYTVISSISVYADFSSPGVSESSPVGTLEDESVEEVTGETYGPLKALCEKAAEEEMPGRVLVIRPGLIVGPHDPSDRFTYWPRRIARGGEVLAPGNPDLPSQQIDVRDLAAWNVRMAEEGKTGTYNGTGPDREVSMREIFESCRRVSGSDARFTWVSDEFLLEKEVAPWMGLPLWLPDTPEDSGFSRVDCSRAFADGLTIRPLEETIADTLAWDATLPADRELRAGITAEKEREILDAWHERVTVGQ